MENRREKGSAKKGGQQEKEKAPAEKTAQHIQEARTPLVQSIQSQIKETIPDSTENLIEVSDLNWEKTVEREKVPVAVMFYSPACVFCHQMEPYFRTLADEFRGSVVFARINIMLSQWTAERYGVRSTPTFKFFCDGKPVQEMVGAIYPALLKRAVEEVLVHGKECVKNSTVIDYEITGYG